MQIESGMDGNGEVKIRCDTIKVDTNRLHEIATMEDIFVGFDD